LSLKFVKKGKTEKIEEKLKETRNTRKTRKKTQQKLKKPEAYCSLPVDGPRPNPMVCTHRPRVAT
jgi:hypothetical protein